MSYIEEQAAFIKKYKIKEGSKVKVLKKALTFQDGWRNSWAGERMDETVGKIYEVGSLKYTCNSGIPLKGTNCRYPYFVLGPPKLRLG